MKELLERWAALEPERCEYQEGLNPHTYEESEAFALWGMGYLEEGETMRNAELIHVDSDFDIPSVQALIQGAVQEAIEARDLLWSVGQTEEGDYVAYVTINKLGDTITGYGPSPAHALLSAYVEAVEATAPAGAEDNNV